MIPPPAEEAVSSSDVYLCVCLCVHKEGCTKKKKRLSENFEEKEHSPRKKPFSLVSDSDWQKSLMNIVSLLLKLQHTYRMLVCGLLVECVCVCVSFNIHGALINCLA